MPASNYLRSRVVDHTFRNVAATPPVAVFVSLHTADPTVVALPASEVAAAWYVRQGGTFAVQTIAGQTSNTNTITYSGVTGAGVTVTHFAIWDAATLGNMLSFAPLAASKVFSVTDVPSWLPGQLGVTLT